MLSLEQKVFWKSKLWILRGTFPLQMTLQTHVFQYFKEDDRSDLYNDLEEAIDDGGVGTGSWRHSWSRFPKLDFSEFFTLSWECCFHGSCDGRFRMMSRKTEGAPRGVVSQSGWDLVIQVTWYRCLRDFCLPGTVYAGGSCPHMECGPFKRMMWCIYIDLYFCFFLSYLPSLMSQVGMPHLDWALNAPVAFFCDWII